MSILKQHATRLVAILIIVIFYSFAQLPDISQTEREQLTQRFNFSQFALPEVPGPEKRIVREVNPNLAHCEPLMDVMSISRPLSV